MFKEVNIFILITIIISSCVSSSDKNIEKQDSIKAEMLITKANESLKMNDHKLALSLLDSIDTLYSGQISVRRKAMILRPRVKELQLMNEIQQLDSLIVVSEINHDSEEHMFQLQLSKEKCERQLQVARNQIVRLENDSSMLSK